MKTALLLFGLLLSLSLKAQTPFADSVLAWQQQYVATHGVVKSEDRHRFRFYPHDSSWRITARIQPSGH